MRDQIILAVLVVSAIIFLSTQTFDPNDIAACLDAGLSPSTCKAMRDYE